MDLSGKRKASKVSLFLRLARPDKYGHSRKVGIEEFTKEFSRLKFGNGGDWCRSDGTLARKYILDICHKNGDTGPIVSIQLAGFNKKHQIEKEIRSDISSEIKKQKCRVLYIGNVEVDHKDGHRDAFAALNPANQSLDDFQPLSAAVNKAKRQHCKDCRQTKTRFDAKKLGFAESFFVGGHKYRGSCVGCYWHDPKTFNYEMSKAHRTPHQQP